MVWLGGRGSLESQKRRRRILLAVGSFLAVCLLFYYLDGSNSGRPSYVLVIDSGSSGTRIYAYTWQLAADGYQAPLLKAVDIKAAKDKIPRRQAGDKRAYERLETEPGLDKFVGDLQGVRNIALGPLLDWAEAVVPAAHRASTPVFLFGTAGLRKLPSADQLNVVGHVQAVLRASAFRFEPSWARVISGQDEGVYGWIALNYLAGRLAPGRGGGGPEPLGGTLAALDLGGSSLEATYVPREADRRQASVNVTVAGVQYPLYTRVLHGKGLNDAFDRSVALLLASATGDTDVLAMETHPLNSTGTQEGISALPLGRRLAQRPPDLPSPRTLRHPCLHDGYNRTYSRLAAVPDPSAASSSPPVVRLVGGFNETGCRELARAVVASGRAACPRDEAGCERAAGAGCGEPICSLPVQPAAGNAVHALTGFYVVYKFFGLDGSASLSELEAAGRSFCATPWMTVERSRGREMHVDHYCFRAPYISALLREGLGIDESLLRLGNGREAWTLGAALAEASRVGMPSSAGAGAGAPPQLGFGAWAVGPGVHLAGILLGGCLLVWVLMLLTAPNPLAALKASPPVSWALSSCGSSARLKHTASPPPSYSIPMTSFSAAASLAPQQRPAAGAANASPPGLSQRNASSPMLSAMPMQPGFGSYSTNLNLLRSSVRG